MNVCHSLELKIENRKCVVDCKLTSFFEYGRTFVEDRGRDLLSSPRKQILAMGSSFFRLENTRKLYSSSCCQSEEQKTHHKFRSPDPKNQEFPPVEFLGKKIGSKNYRPQIVSTPHIVADVRNLIFKAEYRSFEKLRDDIGFRRSTFQNNHENLLVENLLRKNIVRGCIFQVTMKNN